MKIDREIMMRFWESFADKKEEVAVFHRDSKNAIEPGKSVVRIARITSGLDGAYVHVDFPISLDAASMIEDKLRREGKIVRSRGGSGNDHSCSLEYGPFTSAEEAESLIESMAAMVRAVYDVEKKVLRDFSSLIGKTYPI